MLLLPVHHERDRWQPVFGVQRQVLPAIERQRAGVGYGPVAGPRQGQSVEHRARRRAGALHMHPGIVLHAMPRRKDRQGDAQPTQGARHHAATRGGRRGAAALARVEGHRRSQAATQRRQIMAAGMHAVPGRDAQVHGQAQVVHAQKIAKNSCTGCHWRTCTVMWHLPECHRRSPEATGGRWQTNLHSEHNKVSPWFYSASVVLHDQILASDPLDKWFP